MEILLDLLQGAGLAAAIGIRPFLPVLLAGALAAGDVGLDFDGTDFCFLEQWPFLLGVLVLLVRRSTSSAPGGRDAVDGRRCCTRLPPWRSCSARCVAAGSVADRDRWWAGASSASPARRSAFQAAPSLFGRVRRRLDEQAANALPVYARAPHWSPPACRSSSRRWRSS